MQGAKNYFDKLKIARNMEDYFNEQKSISIVRKSKEKRKFRPVVRPVYAWSKRSRQSSGEDFFKRQKNQLLHRMWNLL